MTGLAVLWEAIHFAQGLAQPRQLATAKEYVLRLSIAMVLAAQLVIILSAHLAV